MSRVRNRDISTYITIPQFIVLGVTGVTPGKKENTKTTD